MIITNHSFYNKSLILHLSFFQVFFLNQIQEIKLVSSSTIDS